MVKEKGPETKTNQGRLRWFHAQPSLLCTYIQFYKPPEIVYDIMSAYIKKMETKQKQHAFPVVAWCQSSDSRTFCVWFRSKDHIQMTTPVWSGDPL